jgi:hypothetical protein
MELLSGRELKDMTVHISRKVSWDRTENTSGRAWMGKKAWRFVTVMTDRTVQRFVKTDKTGAGFVRMRERPGRDRK